MTTEIFWLTATIAMTAVLWIPYIVNRIIENGLISALHNPKPDEPPKAQWADRMIHAHQNAIENLVLFAPLVIVAYFLEIQTQWTQSAAMAYFFSRAAHALIYTCGIPYLRTVAFFIGFLAQMVFVVEILL